MPACMPVLRCAGDAYHMMAEAELHARPDPVTTLKIGLRKASQPRSLWLFPPLRPFCRKREGGEQRHMSDTVADEAK